MSFILDHELDERPERETVPNPVASLTIEASTHGWVGECNRCPGVNYDGKDLHGAVTWALMHATAHSGVVRLTMNATMRMPL